MVKVVLFHVGATWRAQFHRTQLEAFLLELCDDLTNAIALHRVWLDHDERALFLWS